MISTAKDENRGKKHYEDEQNSLNRPRPTTKQLISYEYGPMFTENKITDKVSQKNKNRKLLEDTKKKNYEIRTIQYGNIYIIN